MVRVISQETYDEVVKENIDEFEMTPQEAIEDAIAQFEAQGVDLSHIIKDLALKSVDEHLVSTSIKNLKELSLVNADDAVLKELDNLQIECETDIARRVRAGKEGAYKLLLDIFEQNKNSQNQKEIQLNVLNNLVALMDSQPDLLDQRGVELMKRLLDENNEKEEMLIATLKWVSVCCVKHEKNRQAIFNKDILKNLKLLLSENSSDKLIAEVLQVLRKLTLDDDVRVEFGKAHDHARDIALATVEQLAHLLKVRSKPPLVSELMLTLAAVLVRNELCQRVAAAGAVHAIFTVLADNYDNVAVVTQGLKLVTALAGNDDVKRQMVRAGAADLVVSLLQRHLNNASAAGVALKCIAVLALREPEHSGALGAAAAPAAVVAAVNAHPDVSAVQKHACWAIRNMVARRRDLSETYLQLGAEEALGSAQAKFDGEFGYDIRAALRDLGCDVALDEQWTGKGVQLQ